MKKYKDALLDYFFVIGIDEKIQQEILENKLTKLPENASMEILSSYSLEGKTSIFELIKNNIDKNDELKNNLFPMKSDYLDFILSEDYDEEIMGKIKSNFTDYIIYTNEDYSKEHFYHCFQYEFERDNGFTLNLNFGVMIFYEKINSIEMNLQKMNKKHKKKDKDIYLGRALVLVSNKAVFSLMKNILEKIYELLKAKKISEYLNSISVSSILVNPIKNLNENFDSFIVNLFNSLKKMIKLSVLLIKKLKIIFLIIILFIIY